MVVQDTEERSDGRTMTLQMIWAIVDNVTSERRFSDKAMKKVMDHFLELDSETIKLYQMYRQGAITRTKFIVHALADLYDQTELLNKDNLIEMETYANTKSWILRSFDTIKEYYVKFETVLARLLILGLVIIEGLQAAGII
jgi:hypothetical protein